MGSLGSGWGAEGRGVASAVPGLQAPAWPFVTSLACASRGPRVEALPSSSCRQCRAIAALAAALAAVHEALNFLVRQRQTSGSAPAAAARATEEGEEEEEERVVPVTPMVSDNDP